MRPSRVIAAAVGLLTLAGCSDGPKTYPVSGKITLAGGGAEQLAGHHIEAALDSDPNARASGVIGPDGTFALETLYAGTILKGAREGTYRVRLVPADEDDNGKRLKKPPIAPKHLKFEASGPSFQVPTSGDVAIEFSAR